MYLVCSVTQKVSPWLSPLWAGSEPWSVHVGFKVDKVSLGQMYKYFDFLCQ
jgi:hypothetical protein